MGIRLISADVVVPMQGQALLRDAGVAVDAAAGGGILGVATVKELVARFGNMEREHARGVMVPGLVNGHVHLELGYQRRVGDGPVRFTEWVGELMTHYPPAEELERVVETAVREGVSESLKAGVTCVGDISRQIGITRRVLAGGPLRAVSFGEVVGLGKMRGRLEPLLEAAVDGRWASEFLRIGISPHAPYTVEGPSLEAICRRARAGGFPLAMHLAELSEEAEFLRDLSGPLGRGWEVMVKMDVLDAAIPLMAGGPLLWAERWGLLGDNGAGGAVPVVLAHVNECDAAGAELLARSGASVAYCPRTRAFFGHEARGGHPYRQLLAAGVNVCLGTDSLASNPDLSVLKEAALVHRRNGFPALAAMEMITWRGARALGVDAGRIAEGAACDLAVFAGDRRAEDSAESVLSHLLHEGRDADGVWVAGVRAL